MQRTNSQGATRVAMPDLEQPREAASFAGVAAIVLPTLNEEEGLERTLSEIPYDLLNDPEHPVRPVVIDGGSTDRTCAVARADGVAILHQRGKGKGEAVLEAIEWLRRQGVPHLVVLDADATYPADRIGPALDLLREGAELVLGVREPVWGPPRHARELVHRVGNILLSSTASVLSGRSILDICSGFWGVSTRKFAELDLGVSDFAIEAELVLKALRGGLTVAQIPIEYRDRLGKAKLHAWRDGGQILLSILRHARAPPVASPKAPARPAPLRELLSIGLITRTSGWVVDCGPSEFGRAEEIAHALERSLPPNGVAIAASVREEGSDAPEDASATAPIAPMVVRLPPGTAEEGASAVTVSIHSQHRRLRIHLPPPPTAPTTGLFLHGPTARSGGRDLSSRDPSGSWPARFGVVTSRLNFDPAHQQRTMLWANGFQVEEAPRPSAFDTSPLGVMGAWPLRGILIR